MTGSAAPQRSAALRRRWVRATALLSALAGCVLACAVPAAAHAILERSLPSASTTAARSLQQVVLRFTEPVDPAFSRVQITDAAGTVLTARITVSSDGRVLTAAVDALPDGVYTVRWRVLSTYDGHPSSGFFLFGVGRPVPGGSAGRSFEPARPGHIAVRWLAFAAAAVLVGGAVFRAVVLRPASAALSPEHLARAAAVLEATRPPAAVAVMLAAALDFLFQAGGLLGVSWTQALAGGAAWSLLGATRLGWSALVRIAMAAIFLLPSSPRGRVLRVAALLWMLIVGGIVAAFGGPAAISGVMLAPILLTTVVYGVAALMVPLVAVNILKASSPRDRWVLPLAGGFLLAGFTIASHAAGAGPLAVIADWLHLVAAASWVGGLLALLLVLGAFPPPERATAARALVPRMSGLAAAGLAAVAVTGVYGSILHIPALRAFPGTPYGRLLAAKLAVVAVLVALGAGNRYLLRPRLERGEPAPSLLRRFARMVGGEIGAAAVIVAIVAVLTVTPPAATTWTPPAPQPTLRLAGLAEEVRVDLAVSPARPGWNRFEATAVERDRRLFGNDVRILLRLTKLDEALDPTLLSLEDQGGGLFLAEDPGLGLPGWWEVEVIVRRRGRLDASTSFPLHLEDGVRRPAGPDGSALLGRMASTMFQLGSWRETQQITDGAGNVTVSWFDVVHPNRLRYRTAEGTEGVIIGRQQYLRVKGGAWETRTLPTPFRVDDYLRAYLTAQTVLRGREMPCDEEPCVVLLWETPGGSAAFAGWMGLRTSRLHRLLMSAPAHFMTARFTHFNTGWRINPPR
ncbi:MAG: CopD family protein [Armatimonadota bacterium]|nr:CopD family protein [Armatimonadota bacterium]